MAKLSIEDLELAGKRVFIRVDFNVPQDKVTGEITNTKRIEAALPTIQYALDKGAAVVLASHLGRPNGEKNMKYTLAPVAKKLEVSFTTSTGWNSPASSLMSISSSSMAASSGRASFLKYIS